MEEERPIHTERCDVAGVRCRRALERTMPWMPGRASGAVQCHARGARRNADVSRRALKRASESGSSGGASRRRQMLPVLWNCHAEPPNAFICGAAHCHTRPY